MIEAYEDWIRERQRLEQLLSDTGETPVSLEVEHAMRHCRQRVEAQVKNVLRNGQEELMALRRLMETDNEQRKDGQA